MKFHKISQKSFVTSKVPNTLDCTVIILVLLVKFFLKEYFMSLKFGIFINIYFL